jgi:predicted branched-subunit amino acid permease
MMTKSETILLGLKNTFGVIIAFLILFLSLGALMHKSGYSLYQAIGSTALVAAAPLQTAIIQMHNHIAISVVIVLSFAINFRLFIISSAMLPYLRTVPLIKLLFPTQGLAASTFGVVYPDLSEGKVQHEFLYFATVAIVNWFAAVVGTVIGFCLASAFHSTYWIDLFIMILPINFTLLTAKMLPKKLPLVAALAGFVLIPFALQVTPEFGILILPLIIAAGMLILKKGLAIDE